MRVQVFRHSPSDGLGLIQDALDAHGVVCEYADLYRRPESDVSIQKPDALIVMGGSMSANDDVWFIRHEIDCVQSALRLGKPVLGVCLGAQLIAKAVGERVFPNASKEIGWAPVQFTESAEDDPLFHGFRYEHIFHWHGETFDLPQGAHLLASSAACRYQAFRLGDRVYGLQFHLEVTPEMIQQWCREDEACGVAREVSVPVDPYAHSARSMEIARTVFARWCALTAQQIGGSP